MTTTQIIVKNDFDLDPWIPQKGRPCNLSTNVNPIWNNIDTAYFNSTIWGELKAELPRNFLIKLPDENFLEIPSKLEKIADAIEKAGYILDLQDDWDGEGSHAYKPKTWIRAVTFLFNYAMFIYKELNQVIDPPNIYHGPDSSIDIYWAYEDKNLLINIPLDEREKATFYGKYSDGDEVSGKIGTDQFYQGILLWLNKI